MIHDQFSAAFNVVPLFLHFAENAEIGNLAKGNIARDFHVFLRLVDQQIQAIAGMPPSRLMTFTVAS